jgi:putative acetyltransferase
MTSDIAVAIRSFEAADGPHVRLLLEQAFGGTDEADLVDRLMRDGELVLTLAAQRGDKIVGCAAFPRLTVADKSGGTAPAAGLAPLAVAVEARKRGIGGALVRAGLARLRDMGETLVFVLGDPAYYRRFGFEAADPAFRSPYSGPQFMQARLSGGGPVSGMIRYPAAFAALS